MDPHLIANLNLGVPQTPGQTFYVGGSVLPEGAITKSNSNTGLSPREPLSTIAGALDKCVASRGDTIIVMPGYTETVTAKLDLDVAGVYIKGLGNGSLRPKITVNGAVDAVEFSADNITLDNFQFRIVTTDAATSFINIDDDFATVRNIEGICSATSINVVDAITVTANAHDCLIENVVLWNSVVAVNSFLSLEGAASRVTVRNFFAFGDCATAGIIDAAKVDYLVLDNVRVSTVGTTIPAATLDSNPEGIAMNCMFAGTHTTLATNAALGNSMRLFNVWVTEETDGSKQGAQIPAVDTE
jgi:hypothetical protein